MMTVTNVEAVSALMLELARLDEARKRLQNGRGKVRLQITAGHAGGAPCLVAFPLDEALAFVQRCIEANNKDLARFGVEIAKPADRDRSTTPQWQTQPAAVLKFPRAVEPDAVEPDADGGAA